MSRAEEIANKVFDPRQSPDNYKAVVSALDEAMEWSAQQCERECLNKGHSDFCHSRIADLIRAGKSK